MLSKNIGLSFVHLVLKLWRRHCHEKCTLLLLSRPESRTNWRSLESSETLKTHFNSRFYSRGIWIVEFVV